jgi:hypothetical protein
MRGHNAALLAAAALIVLAAPRAGASPAHAESRWSGVANAGFVIGYTGMGLGGSLGLFHAAGTLWSIGPEVGYSILPGFGFAFTTQGAFAPPSPTGSGIGTSTLGLVVRARTPGSQSLHALGGFGYYDQETRIHYMHGPDVVEHTRLPGWSFGIGGSAGGSIRPGFQVRWRHLLRREEAYQPFISENELSFEAGVHFN